MRTALALTNEFTWLAVGRLVEQKDYPNLFRALALLPAGNWILLIAGKGPLEASLKALATELGLGLSTCVFLALRTTCRYVQRCGCICHVIQLRRSFGRTARSSRTGLPAVVTNAGGNGELVLDQTNRIHCSAAGFPSSSVRHEAAHEHGGTGKTGLGTAARQHCLDHYRFDKIARTWVRLYSRLLAIRPGTPALETYPQSDVAAGDSSAS
jgi:glycosyltransferase involved in cell wall biosynthesis